MEAVRHLAKWIRLRTIATAFAAVSAAQTGCDSTPKTRTLDDQWYPNPASGYGQNVYNAEKERNRSAADYQAAQNPQNTTARPQAPIEPPGPIVLPGPITLPTPTNPTPTAPVVPNTSQVVPAGGPRPDQAATQIRVIAMIGSDVVITDDEVWQMVRQRAGEYIRLTGTERDSREKELFREELRRLIERELILAELLARVKKAKPHVMEELKEEASRQATRQIKEFKKNNKFRTEEEFNEVLRSQGVSMKGLQRQLERNALMNIYLNQVFKERKKDASLADVVRYYEEHADEFKLEDRVKWQDLFVSYRYFNNTVEARQYTEALLKQIQGGADFVEVVKKSGHGDSKLRDGEGAGNKRGEITPRELEESVFQLEVGQLSNVIATETGLHIIKILERDVAGTRPFDEKTQLYIRNKLGALAQKAEYEKLIEELWRKTSVKVIDLP